MYGQKGQILNLLDWKEQNLIKIQKHPVLLKLVSWSLSVKNCT